jgi:hypothetical protein
MKPDPNDPSKVLFNDPHTGKDKRIPKPDGFDEYWNERHPPARNPANQGGQGQGGEGQGGQQQTSYCSENPGTCIGATMVIIGVGALCILAAPELLPLLALGVI